MQCPAHPCHGSRGCRRKKQISPTFQGMEYARTRIYAHFAPAASFCLFGFIFSALLRDLLQGLHAECGSSRQSTVRRFGHRSRQPRRKRAGLRAIRKAGWLACCICTASTHCFRLPCLPLFLHVSACGHQWRGREGQLRWRGGRGWRENHSSLPLHAPPLHYLPARLF